MVLVLQEPSTSFPSTSADSERPVRMRGLSQFSEVEHHNVRVQEVSGNLSHLPVPNVESSSVAPLAVVASALPTEGGASHPSQPMPKLC